MIGNTYDNRRIVNLDSDSLNSIYINQTISPKEIVMLSHSNEVKRRPNVAKGIKVNISLIYIKKCLISEFKLSILKSNKISQFW